MMGAINIININLKETDFLLNKSDYSGLDFHVNIGDFTDEE